MFCKFATAWQDKIKMIKQGKILFEGTILILQIYMTPNSLSTPLFRI